MLQQNRNIERFLACVFVVVSMFFCMATGAAATAQSVEGRWAASGKYLDNGEQEKAILDFKQSDGSITGTVRAMGWINPVTGTVSGTHFKVFGPWSDQRPFFTGEIVNGGLEIVLNDGDKWSAHPVTAADEFPQLPYIKAPALHAVPANGLALTPPMGWNSWNLFEGRIDDQTVRTMANAMVSSGMRDAGYIYVNIDDTWEGVRDAEGKLQPNHKFPDMKALADYVHSKGLKLGIYSSPGPRTCAGYPASYGREEQDATRFADWVSAAVLLSVIGDIRDFSDPGKLAAYLGLVPRVQNSNETTRSRRITKQGNKLARTALVQCALVAKRYSSHPQKFYQRIQRRRGGGKANIALARKFLGVIYHTLKNDWVFENFPNFVLAS